VPDIFKSELTDLIESGFEYKFNNCFTNLSKYNFYIHLPEKYSNFKQNAYKINSMFPSQYLCEKLFSLLKFRKNSYSSQITQNNLKDCLRIATNKTMPDFKMFVN